MLTTFIKYFFKINRKSWMSDLMFNNLFLDQYISLKFWLIGITIVRATLLLSCCEWLVILTKFKNSIIYFRYQYSKCAVMVLTTSFRPYWLLATLSFRRLRCSSATSCSEAIAPPKSAPKASKLSTLPTPLLWPSLGYILKVHLINFVFNT